MKNRNERMMAYDMFPELLDGKGLAQKGMQQAVDHAEEVHDKWADKAYSFLQKFVGYHKGPFQTEDVRMASLNAQVPEPPSKRAWGLIVVRAKKAKLIRHVGFKAVSNPRAHGTPASVWMKV